MGEDEKQKESGEGSESSTAEKSSEQETSASREPLIHTMSKVQLKADSGVTKTTGKVEKKKE